MVGDSRQNLLSGDSPPLALWEPTLRGRGRPCLALRGFRTPWILARRPLATGELSAFFFHL